MACSVFHTFLTHDQLFEGVGVGSTGHVKHSDLCSRILTENGPFPKQMLCQILLFYEASW